MNSTTDKLPILVPPEDRLRVAEAERDQLRADLAAERDKAKGYLAAGIEALGLFHSLYRGVRAAGGEIPSEEAAALAATANRIADALGLPPAEKATVPVLRCGACDSEFLGEEGKDYKAGVLCPAERGRGRTIVGVCHVVRHVTPPEAARLREVGWRPEET